MLVNWNGLDRLALHVDVPDLDGQVVAGKDIATIVREADVGYGGDNFREE